MHRAIVPFLAVFLVCATAGTSAAERPGIGRVDRVHLEARAEFDGAVRRLAEGDRLLSGDTLRTGADARLRALLDDDTEITLGADAVLSLDSFVYDGDAGRGSLALRVLEGTFLFVGGAVETVDGAALSIVTPVATIGIRGTTVWGGPIDGGYGVLVLDGSVTVTTPGGSVDLEAGDATMIAAADAAPDVPAPWSAEKVARAIATVTFDDR